METRGSRVDPGVPGSIAQPAHDESQFAHQDSPSTAAPTSPFTAASTAAPPSPSISAAAATSQGIRTGYLAVFAIGVLLAVGLSTVLHHPVALDLGLTAVIVGSAAVVLWHVHARRDHTLNALRDELSAAHSTLAELESERARRLHDARNTIFAISGATQLLAHPAEISDSDAEHLQELINAELNRLAQVLDPRVHSIPQRITTSDLLAPIVSAYRAQGTAISAHIEECALVTHRGALTSALSNILTNARVHAASAHIWLTALPSFDVRRECAVVRITISDNGPGIAPELRELVLQPGVRGITTVPGSGLGLASVAQVMAELGGELVLTERPGGGTSVTLVVPVASPVVPSTHTPAIAPETSTA